MYSASKIDKIGNAVIYLTTKIDKVSKTKLLKLLYILDEISIKKSGIPFFNLEYKVWKFGPVNVDMYVEFTSSPSMLKKYISKTSNNEHEYIIAKTDFNDDEFSQFDIDLMNEVVDIFGSSDVNTLIKYTHRKQSPWYNTAERNNVLELLENEQQSVTDFVIDLSELIQYDERKLSIYTEFLELN